MLGTRQSGLAQFRVARLPEDAELLDGARRIGTRAAGVRPGSRPARARAARLGGAQRLRRRRARPDPGLAPGRAARAAAEPARAGRAPARACVCRRSAPLARAAVARAPSSTLTSTIAVNVELDSPGAAASSSVARRTRTCGRAGAEPRVRPRAVPRRGAGVGGGPDRPAAVRGSGSGAAFDRRARPRPAGHGDGGAAGRMAAAARLRRFDRVRPPVLTFVDQNVELVAPATRASSTLTSTIEVNVELEPAGIARPRLPPAERTTSTAAVRADGRATLHRRGPSRRPRHDARRRPPRLSA